MKRNDHSAVENGLAPAGEHQYWNPEGAPVLAEWQRAAWRREYIERARPWVASDLTCGDARCPSLSDIEALVHAHRAFGIQHECACLYPRIQFDTVGRSLPVIADLIELIISADVDWWRLAHFLDVPSYFLGDTSGSANARRPADLLITEPDAVLYVIKRELGLTRDL